MKAQLCGDHDSRTWPCGMAGAGLTPLILVKEGEIVQKCSSSPKNPNGKLHPGAWTIQLLHHPPKVPAP